MLPVKDVITQMQIGYVMRRCFLAFGLTLVTSMAAAEENASNPLASVNNVDLRWQYTSSDPGDKHDVFVDGSYMLMPVLKLKYELHYNFTDVTGSDENDFENIAVKIIVNVLLTTFFFTHTNFSTSKLRLPLNYLTLR